MKVGNIVRSKSKGAIIGIVLFISEHEGLPSIVRFLTLNGTTSTAMSDDLEVID